MLIDMAETKSQSQLSLKFDIENVNIKFLHAYCIELIKFYEILNKLRNYFQINEAKRIGATSGL